MRLNVFTVAIVIFVALIATPVSRMALMYAVEDAYLYVHPSANRAFAFAERHFSPDHPHLYDSDRALLLYTRAFELDEMHPLALHHMARAEFVSKNPARALQYIEEHIARHPDTPPSAYYIQGLSHAFLGKYAEASADYERYITYDVGNWPAYNDLAWVLLKDKKPAEALAAVDRILPRYPENPWLLTTRATALYEIGKKQEAYETILHAKTAASTITEADWRAVNPGNDPSWAPAGIATMRAAIDANIAQIEGSIQTVQ